MKKDLDKYEERLIVNEFKNAYEKMLITERKIQRYNGMINEIEVQMMGVKSPTYGQVPLQSGMPHDAKIAELVTKKLNLQNEVDRMLKDNERVKAVLKIMPLDTRAVVEGIYRDRLTYEELAKKAGYSAIGLKKRIDHDIFLTMQKYEKSILSTKIYAIK